MLFSSTVEHRIERSSDLLRTEVLIGDCKEEFEHMNEEVTSCKEHGLKEDMKEATDKTSKVRDGTQQQGGTFAQDRYQR